MYSQYLLEVGRDNLLYDEFDAEKYIDEQEAEYPEYWEHLKKINEMGE